MAKAIPWRSWIFTPGEHGNYQPAYVRLRSLGHPGGALVGEVFTGSTSAQSQGFDPLVVPTLVDRLKRKVVVDSKVICEYIENEIPSPVLMPPVGPVRAGGPSSPAKAHGELIKKHLTLVDETPHMGMLYGLHLSDMLQDKLVVAFAKLISTAHAGQIKSVEAYLADSSLPSDLRPLYEAKKKKTELAQSRVGKSGGTKEGYKEMLNKVATFLSELESDLKATGGPFICGAECTMADLVWHTSLLRLYELGFDGLFSEEKLPKVHQYAMRILRHEGFAQATYLWPYKPVTRNLRRLMAEKKPLQAFVMNLMSKMILGGCSCCCL